MDLKLESVSTPCKYVLVKDIVPLNLTLMSGVFAKEYCQYGTFVDRIVFKHYTRVSIDGELMGIVATEDIMLIVNK